MFAGTTIYQPFIWHTSQLSVPTEAVAKHDKTMKKQEVPTSFLLLNGFLIFKQILANPENHTHW